ncbi:hypothetical protein CTAYLR_000201 [Chrysophaeum taylorii]|uniref:Kelch repeat-containing protein n=1 Tax=Chrysophaeum taylorii TaxID=2483200 RepID=A0AAD7XL09_9STRA|nr:hypothetical protein CTAYLR_000201 [Chrysophaeum taylorii]
MIDPSHLVIVTEYVGDTILNFLSLASLGALESTHAKGREFVRRRGPFAALYAQLGGGEEAAVVQRRSPPDFWRRRLRLRVVARDTTTVKLAAAPSKFPRSLPLGLGGAAVARFDDGAIYCMGGATRGFDLESRAWLWTRDDGWREQASRPSARWQHSLVLASGALWLYGGEVDAPRAGWAVEPNVYAIHRTTDGTTCRVVPAPDAPPASSGHSCIVDARNGRIVFFGGRVAEFECTAALRAFDYVLERWIVLDAGGSPPSPRWCHSVVVLGCGDGVVFGGWDVSTTEFLNDVHVLEGVVENHSLRWSKLVDAVGPTPRCQAPCFYVPADDDDPGWMLVFGGACYERNRAGYGLRVRDLCDAWIFDLATRSWDSLKCDDSLLALRGGCNAALCCDDARLLCGGIHNNDHDTLPFFIDQVVQLVVCDPRLRAVLPALGPAPLVSPGSSRADPPRHPPTNNDRNLAPRRRVASTPATTARTTPFHSRRIFVPNAATDVFL